MKVVFVLALADLSGGVRVVAQYARLLQQRGHRVLVISTPHAVPGAVTQIKSLVRGRGWMETPRVGTSHLDHPDIEHHVLERFRAVRDSDVPDSDVVIATWWQTVEWVQALAPSKGIKAHLVQDHEIWGGPRAQVDAAYRAPLAKLVVSSFLRDLLRREYGVDAVAVIPNGVDTVQFDAPPRRKQPVPTVGLNYATKHNKGTDIALKAFELASRSVPGLRLVAMGNEPVSPELPLPACTEYALRARDGAVRDLYARCDAWLFPTRWEGFGLPVLEAMACRTPVIGTPAGAAPEAIGRGGGVLVPPEDPEAMARAIAEVHAMPEESWMVLSASARETAMSFSLDASAAAFESTLLGLCRGRAGDRDGRRRSTWSCTPARSTPPRVLLVSQRLLSPELSRCLRFEFEDAAAALDAVDLLAPDRHPVASRAAALAWAGVARVVPAAARLLGSGLGDIHDRYDLVLLTVESLSDLLPLEPVLPYLRRGRVNACCIDEVWRNGLARRTGELRLLKGFDLIFSTMEGSVELLAELTGRPCRYLPPSTDALALCPWPSPPERVIDVYSMGRRSPETHGALVALAARNGAFYFYDTVGNVWTTDFREHRKHLADVLRRTRFFLSYPGKMDVPHETGGQQEVGFRYFEGAAAGVVLVGEAPMSPSFDRIFGWTDSVIRLPYGSRDVERCLAALEADPERVRRIRRSNVLESLTRHDHVHRWIEILDAVGLSRPAAIGARLEALRARAALVHDAAPLR